MKPSKFNIISHAKDEPSRSILYNTLHDHRVLFDADLNPEIFLEKVAKGYPLTSQENEVARDLQEMGLILEDNVDEQQAIRRLKQGDISGLEFLVLRFQLKAVRTAYLITRDLELAEDVVQESFIRAYRSINSFDEMRPFEPWFLRSVVHASVKMMQKTGGKGLGRLFG